MTKHNQDIHSRITDAVIAAIEAGAGSWTMPWHRACALYRPVNIASDKPYRGINILSLWIAASANGYASPLWGTYRQWAAKGAQVRKGEKASPIVFYREFEVENASTENAERETETRLMARASSVFNVDQVDGFEPEPAEDISLIEPITITPIDETDRFVNATGADIRHGGGRAFYAPDADRIQMPLREDFIATETSTATEGYYSTLLHELTHWSGAKHRLDRQFGKRFGDDAYAMEELCAELGAAFLCADLRVSNQPRADHAAYLDHWLRILKADKRAIFTAASQASKALDFLEGLQPTS